MYVPAARLLHHRASVCDDEFKIQCPFNLALGPSSSFHTQLIQSLTHSPDQKHRNQPVSHPTVNMSYDLNQPPSQETEETARQDQGGNGTSNEIDPRARVTATDLDLNPEQLTKLEQVIHCIIIHVELNQKLNNSTNNPINIHTHTHWHASLVIDHFWLNGSLPPRPHTIKLSTIPP